jgi:S-adenosylmethionine/arginine decarboxylase-like enzyme
MEWTYIVPIGLTLKIGSKENKLLVHHHLVVRAELSAPPTDPTYITIWKKKLVEAIGMKILMGPYATYSDMLGNRGLTVATVIETSHIVLHVWDEESPGLMQLDVYSCAEFDRQTIFDAIQEFVPTKIDYKFLDRTGDFILAS